MRYILLLLPFLIHTEYALSEQNQILVDSLQLCDPNDLVFHKPTIKGVTHWKLIPAASRFSCSRKIIARISQNGETILNKIDTFEQAITLVERNVHQAKIIEWLFFDENQGEEPL